jgi:esterase/lipase superfamily enzyme
MHHETAGWRSPLLGRDMTLEVVGHAGARVLVFPTSMGTQREWLDRGMHQVLADHLEQGWIQLFCLDQPHEENWGNEAVHPGHRAWVHGLYHRYVREEALPFTQSRNPSPFVIAAGTSLGATHAMTYALKYPETVQRILGLSGMYDLKRMTGGYSDDSVYAVNPMDFMCHEHDPGRLEAFRRQDIIMAIGRDDPMYQDNQDFSTLLWSKGISHALRIWDGWVHDWPYWEQMVRRYLKGHD